ncbi:glycosyltransferase family 52 [Methanolobus bombayensis]|uniref:glycosyltransferase family 52 n=1 Tax=Methanolobus bombayensis TaxID=38023 RepID=UPI001AE3397E|nr:glycosyltransferase family 52 [Methanolobus bombayensis]MBP1908195.1 glycosyltransferase involved in cell wall biosynthesis [Methanolobus bombayensis]
MTQRFLAIASRYNHVSTLDPVVKTFKKRSRRIIYLNVSSFYERVNSKCSKRSITSGSASLYQTRIIDKRTLLKDRLLDICVLFSSLLLRIYRPSTILVVSENTLPEKIAVLASNKLHIPTIRIQEGVYGKSYVPGIIKVNMLAVMGPFFKSLLIDCGVSSNMITVTGQPRYDSLFQRKMEKSCVFTKQELDLPSDKKLVLLATQPVSDDQRWALIYSVCNTIRDNSEILLMIKPHPSESNDLHEKVVHETQIQNYMFCENMDIIDLVNVCDVLITIHSTVALEAMFFEKPVITVNYSGQEDIMSYAEEGAAIGVYSFNELTLALDKALHDDYLISQLRKKQKVYLHDYLYRIDGKASERIVTIAETLVYDERCI